MVFANVARADSSSAAASSVGVKDNSRRRAAERCKDVTDHQTAMVLKDTKIADTNTKTTLET